MSRPFRFTFILFLAAFATALAAVGGWRYARASAPVSGPIIVVSVDTLRADHLPAYGYTKVRTPAIDALAADGVVFERAYAHAPQTLPAHAAILTGRLPFETGVRDNIGFTIKGGDRLVSEMLRDRGFATAGIVSSYLLRKETGIAKGFSFFNGDMPAGSPDAAGPPLERDGMISESIAEQWLDRVGTPRAFLFLHVYELHAPYAPPERFAQYEPYDGEIAYVDEIVGRLVRYLKSHQLYDHSTIVLLSDHGEGLGDHGEQEHGLFVYDEAIHVPLVIKQESNVGAGRRVRDVVQHIDLVPTILDLAKAPVPGNLRGRSLKPVLEGTGRLQPAAVYSEAWYGRYAFGWSELTAITDGRYRYIRAPREELYDLAQDAAERTNVAGDRRQARNALDDALGRLTANARTAAPAEIQLDAQARLESLGYISSLFDPTDSDATLADPKDRVETLERYRHAVMLAGEHEWPQAISELQQILHENPDLSIAWRQLGVFAMRLDHYDQAVDAYKHAIELDPARPNGYLGAASALLKARKLDEAGGQAARAAEVAPEKDARSRAASHELLARIALARHDGSGARDEAALAQKAEPVRPVSLFVEGRLLYDEGELDEAVDRFEQAAARTAKAGLPMAELHFYLAESLARLDRYDEAAAQYLEELKSFPQHARARAGLAQAYQALGNEEAARRTAADMTRIVPTPESYALAARLWTTLGNREQADAVRAEARRAFAERPRSGARPSTR